MADPFQLDRFVKAQDDSYSRALAELKAGRKRSHWMWYVFPQLAGLGQSATSRYYAIKNLDEARAYLSHPILSQRLRECVQVLLGLENLTADEVFGYPDTLKLQSSATLFAQICDSNSEFHLLLAKYFEGESDQNTLRLLKLPS